MTIWPPQKNSLVRPKYRSLANAMLQAIAAGEITKGDRLPTHRELAYQLGISVQTVSRAYEELIRLGAINGEIGRGTFVSGNQIEAKTPYFYLPSDQRRALIDLSILKPVCDQIHIDTMRSALVGLAENLPADVVFSFKPASERHFYLTQAQAWLKGCGVERDMDSILLTNGNTSSMSVALMTAARSGDIVVTEELSHHTLKPLTSYLGLRLMGCRADEDGLVPEEFERVCANNNVKALYIMPNGLNPKARTMGEERRQRLASLARKLDISIIESDAWGPIQPDRHPPIATFAPERTFYFTSLTKCLMPGLRVGYLVVPEAMMAATRNRHLVTNWMATSIPVEIASRWIKNGTAADLLDWQKSALHCRNQIAAEKLSEIDYLSSPNGLHIWMPYPNEWNEDSFISHLRQKGVAVGPGSAFAVDNESRAGGVRICLGPTPEEDLAKGLEIIKKLLCTQPILENQNL